VTARSYLYVPGDNADRLARSTSRGADAVIADLEDAVAPANRDEARRVVASWLQTSDDSGQRWVRINSGADGIEDLRAVCSTGLFGVVIPKVDSVDDVAEIVLAATQLAGNPDDDSGRRAGPLRVMALIETARGLSNLDGIAAHLAIDLLQLGELDLAADLRLTPSPDETELLFARSRIVTAAAAAGLPPPVAPVSPDFQDLARFQLTTDRLRRLGFVGRAVIHPRQIAPVHQAFTPPEEELKAALRNVSAYESAVLRGTAVIVDDAGRMVDEAVVRASRLTIDLARNRTEQGRR